MSGSGHTLLLGNTSGTSGSDISAQMGCFLSRNSSCEVPHVSEQPSLVTIHLHGGFSECLPMGDTTRSVEEIIRRLLRKYYSVGPATIHLFGLALLDMKKNDRFIWKSPRCLIKNLQGQMINNPNLKLYVRVRFVPAKDRLSKLKVFGNSVIKYLYHQLREDLLSERMRHIYGSRNQLTSPKCRGLAVLNLLIDSRLQKKPVETILEQHKLKDFLPPSECVAFLKKMKLEKNMKDHVKKFDQSHPENSTDIDELMTGYIRDILKEILDYSVEQYDANVLDTTQSTSKSVPKRILVDIHHNPSGVFIDDIPFSDIEELCSASITPNYKRDAWNVHLDRTNGKPAVLEFENEEVAESFVSCLDGYYRLIHDFYFSLCSNMEPLSLQVLKRIKSHGPIETSCAIEKLNAKMDDQERYYLCKQDIKEFDKFVLAYPLKGQIMTEFIQQKDGFFHLLRDEEKLFQYPSQLVPYLLQTEHNNILSNNMIRLKPNVEACGVLKRLFMEEKEVIPDEDKQQKDESALSRQPVIIPGSHLNIKKLIGIGKFTEVHEGTYKDDKTVAIKSLRTKTSPNQLYTCLEPFLYALRQHMKFCEIQEPSCFAGILGVCMSMPIKIVMDYANEGSLSHFFSNRRTDQPIYLRHLVYAATQVAQGLFQLEERNLHHGNICCQNILVYRYNISEVIVKIGDPGMIQVYEDPSLANNEKVNKKRFPWIAPELFVNSHSCANIKSDIFAFGTTIWEMFALGDNPIDKPPLSSMSFEKQKNFYQSPQRHLPSNEGLRITQNDSTHMKKCKEAMSDLIQRCRVASPDERPTAKELLRDLNTLTASYANEYHDYDRILDEDCPIWSDAETSEMSHDLDSNEEVPDISNSFLTQHFDEIRPSNQQLESQKDVAVMPIPDLLPITSTQASPVPSRPLPGPFSNRPLPQQPTMENPTMIRMSQLQISQRNIGEGHYGMVKKGYLKRFNDHSIPIAAKCLKGNEYESVLQSREFKREAKMMEGLNHPNIVRFYGICNDMIIMEYVDNGAMSVFLREQEKANNSLSANKLMKIMLNIAEGMKYMSDKRIIHSDLAGRNILMTKDLHAKISDFGLARHLSKDKNYYRRSKEKELPASWCSPEGLMYFKFTTLGDVWSYGVVLWEAFTHGKRPSYGKDLKNLTQRLSDGERLERPDSPQRCPDRIWDLMKWCWKYAPNERPSFQEIRDECSEILEELQTKEVQADPNLQQDGVPPSPLPTPVTGVIPPVIPEVIETSQVPVPGGQDPVIVSNVHTNLPSSNFPDQNGIVITSPEINMNTVQNSQGAITPTSPMSHRTDLHNNNQVPLGGIGRPFDRDLPRKPRDDFTFLIAKKELEVNRGEMLGQGEFGFVYKGRYRQEEVAVKVIEDVHLNKYNEELFWEEVDVFGKAFHPNIVTFRGFVRDAHMLIMEFVPRGSLSVYLAQCSAGKATLSLRQNLGIMNDIAAGMNYLVGQSIIHCDLAARNILLMDNMMAKISDFGLSKALSKDKDYYRRVSQKRMPCWWCAPEVLLYQRLSHQSDVWSYGIVAWEIFTLGEIPNICEVGGRDIKDLILIGINHMEKGFRLKKEKTKNCPDDVYGLMMKCWAWEAKDRPQFSFIYQQCLSFLDKYGETIQQQ